MLPGSQGSRFFFVKKNQKTFVRSAGLLSPAAFCCAWQPPTARPPNAQKFFGSFFQKRTFLLLRSRLHDLRPRRKRARLAIHHRISALVRVGLAVKRYDTVGVGFERRLLFLPVKRCGRICRSGVWGLRSVCSAALTRWACGARSGRRNCTLSTLISRLIAGRNRRVVRHEDNGPVADGRHPCGRGEEIRQAN